MQVQDVFAFLLFIFLKIYGNSKLYFIIYVFLYFKLSISRDEGRVKSLTQSI